MSYLLFLDESGIDQHTSPYEVLAGIAVRDQHLWNLICRIEVAEVEHFGQRVTAGALELKGRSLLKRKTFRLAAQLSSIEAGERRRLAQSCLEKGLRAKGGQVPSGATRSELTALAQAKIAFVSRVLELCGNHYVRALYFRNTARGRLRASRIIPEPFFVHSELTTAIQISDLVAYIIAWGIRFGAMAEPQREELGPLGELVCELRYRTRRVDQPEHPIWSFTLIEDLRPREERENRD